MQKKISLVLVFVLSFLFFTSAKSTEKSDIVISEIGATEPSGYEWVEIYNRGDYDIDLTGYKFFEDNTNHSLTLKQGSLVLKKHEFAVITQDDVKFKQKYPGVTSTLLDSSWGSLNESGEEIGLKDKSGTMLEKFIFVATVKFSLERVDVMVDEFTLQNWKEHANANTVGQVNSVVEEPSPSPDPVVPQTPLAVLELPTSGEEPPSSGESSPATVSSSTTEQTPPSMVSESDVPDTSFPKSESEEAVAEEQNIPIKLFISEFLPQPSDGEKEWVEIFNDSPQDVDLNGWTLEDGSGKVAGPTSTLGAQQFLVIELASSKLNNDGDALFLKNFNGEVVDSVYYGDGDAQSEPAAPQKGNTLARTGRSTNFLETTTPTKGRDNTITSPAPSPAVPNNPAHSVLTPTSEENIHTAPSVPMGTLVINEVYPNPPGPDTEDEFVEIFNTANYSIDLSGYKFTDAAGTSFTFRESIAPNGFVVVYRKVSHISLNNTGSEIIRLFSPSGEMVAEFTYQGSREGESINRGENGETQWSIRRTPHEKNRIEEKIIEDEESETSDNMVDKKATGTTKIGKKNIIFDAQILQAVKISEIYPSPEKGKEEFIELYNASSTTLDISFFQIDDQEGGSKPYEFPQGTFLSPQQYLVVIKKQSSLSLNNNEDSVRFLTPTGELIHEVVYEDIHTGNSYAQRPALEESEWEETDQVTAGAKNIFHLEEDENLTQKTKKGVVVTTIENLTELEKGDRVQVRGKVSVLPQTLSTQYFYMQDTRGVQIYMSKKDFPPLSVGEEIQVTGELSQIQDEQRIKVKAKTDIVKMGTIKKLEPQTITLADINEVNHGMVVQVTGEVTEKKPTFIYVDDGTGEIQVNIKKGTGIETQKIHVGDTVAVTGIVLLVKEGLQLFLRTPEDVSMLTVAATSTVPVSATSISQNEKNILVATGGGIGSLLLGFLAKVHGNKLVEVGKRTGSLALTIIRKKKNLG